MNHQPTSHAVVEAGLVIGLTWMASVAAPIASILGALWIIIRIWQEPTTQKFIAWVGSKFHRNHK